MAYVQMIKRVKSLLSSSTSKDALITLVGNIGTTIWGILFTVIVARNLRPDQFGLFSALTALAVLLASISDLGTGASLVNFLPKTKKLLDLISLTFWFQLLIGLTVSLFLVAALPIRQLVIPGSTKSQIVLISILIFIFILNGFSQKVLRAQKKFYLTALLHNIDGSLKLLFVLLLVNLGLFSLEVVIISILVAAFLVMLLGITQQIDHLSIPKSFDLLPRLISFGRWTGLNEILKISATHISPIFLVALSSNFEAGIFAAANRITVFYSLVHVSLNGVIAPRLSHFKTRTQTLDYLKKVAGLISLIVSLILASLYFVPLLVTIIFGSNYQASIPVFRYLTLAMIPGFFSLLTTVPITYFFNRPKFTSVARLIQVLFLITLNLFLIPKYGAIGPAISLGVSNLLLLLITGVKLITLLV